MKKKVSTNDEVKSVSESENRLFDETKKMRININLIKVLFFIINLI
ncbi:MAG: hypothetical protein GX677_05270 [Treponema sp.]|nr:hypothetical protein [Treponema sp.]